MAVAQVVDLGYNCRSENHIKSSGALERRHYPFSNCNRGAAAMSHSTRTPYFPANLDEHAPWVTTHGLVAPYGKCQCGCGQDAPISAFKRPERGQIKGHPVRFVSGHNGRTDIPAPEGFKVCTRCNETKPLSKFYQHKSGPRAGEHRHFCMKCFQETWDQRYSDPEKRQDLNDRARKWRAENRERVKAAQRNSAIKHRDRASAGSAVRYQVQRGAFPPAWSMVCEICKENQAAHWHHYNGYDKANRLNVIAVCINCHVDEHRMEL